MRRSNSPLDFLAAFAIAYLAGIATTAGIATYIRWVHRRHDARND